MKYYIKLLRPKHYLKNVLIFLPLFFSGNLFSRSLLLSAVFGFLSFSFLASAIYIINDIYDVKEDRLHRTKKNRPIASGVISIKNGAAYGGIIFFMGAFFAFLSSPSPLSYGILAAYLVMNLLYSIGRLKEAALVDILILAFGFLLRLLYGAVITSIEISPWLYLTVIVASFYLGMGKRRNELRTCQENGAVTRSVLRHYTANFLDRNMYMCMSLAIAFYSLWCIDAGTVMKYGSNRMLWTIPLVLVIAMKYSLIIEGTSDSDPIEVIFKDKSLLILTAIYAGVMYWMIYI